MFIEKKNYKKIEIKQLTVISSLVALSAVLTNAIGYSIQIPIAGSNIMLALGVIAAISTDLIGSMISIGGFPYHAGYMLDKVLIAFMGGLILIREVLSGNDKLENEIKISGLNRAGLELAGYFEKGAKTRRLVFLSTKESGYIMQFDEKVRREKYNAIMKIGSPAIIITPKFTDKTVIEVALENKFPILRTKEEDTGNIMKKILEYTDVFFAEQIELHATLMQIFGKGVLLTGESGIGKSEIALELINSNHLFVGDDRIVVTKMGEILIGKCHPILLNLVEVRGVGIIDVSKTQGYQSIIDETKIDLVIELVHFKKDGIDDSDRLGSGPAGMSAAVYTSRAGLSTVMVEKEAPGGKVVKTDEIENYLGLESIKGPDLAMKFYTQSLMFGAKHEFSSIKSIKREGINFITELENGKVFESKTLIIATGTKENQIGVPGEVEYYGKGVSYCAVCDAAFHKGNEVVVVGGGYSAIEESIFLTRFASKVYLVHRRGEFRADQKTVSKAKANEKIVFLTDSVVEDVQGENGFVNKVNVINLKSNKKTSLNVSAIFPFVGSTPNTDFVPFKEILDESKNIITDEKMATSIQGLFAAGDVRRSPLRQVAIAVGEGALAGQMAVQYVEHITE
ncbi:hypothetical protein FQR65_LT16679 [Abscondita terminalis]|nr:hypothetical protein FQR65_LT16679 [Abscondita terminalis]